jgi:hypothetical protein
MELALPDEIGQDVEGRLSIWRLVFAPPGTPDTSSERLSAGRKPTQLELANLALSTRTPSAEKRDTFSEHSNPRSHHTLWADGNNHANIAVQNGNECAGQANTAHLALKFSLSHFSHFRVRFQRAERVQGAAESWQTDALAAQHSSVALKGGVCTIGLRISAQF